MAVFNNGSITATVTPPQGYTGPYSYELLKYDNGSWVTVTAAAEGYNANLFINPISTSATTYTFGNPDGFDDNIEGSSTWRGLKPAQYKVEVTTLTGLTCTVEGTATVGSDDPTDPCYGFNISASVDSDTAITVTVTGGTASFTWTLNGSGAAAFDNGDGTFTFNNLTPSTFYTIGVVDANSCTDSVTATTTGTVDPCIGFAAGVTSTVANETTQGANDGTMTITVNAGTAPFDLELDGGAATYELTALGSYTFTGLAPGQHTVVVTDAANCQDTETKTVGAATDLCVGFVEGTGAVEISNVTDASVQGASDGSITVLVGFVGQQPYELNLNSGQQTQDLNGAGQYQFTGLAAGNYTIEVTDYNLCVVNLTATVADGVDPCAGFNGIQVTAFTNPTFGGATNGSITVEVLGGSGSYTWTLNGNATTPTDNGDGTFTFSGLSAAEGAGTQYTIALTDASCGTDNTQQTLVDPGSTGGTDERTWYYFHGYDTNTINIAGGYLTSPSDGNYYLSVNGTYQGFVSTLTEAFQHILDNQGSAPSGMSIDSFEMNESITGNGGATTWTYQATASPQSYYLAVPDNALFTENLTQGDYVSFPYPTNPPQDLPEVADLQINGVNYKLYLLPGQTEAASLTAGLA
jgi:hypothetical protein